MSSKHEAPIIIDGKISRKLWQDEKIERRKTFEPPYLIFQSRTLAEFTPEELRRPTDAFTQKEVEVLQGHVDNLSKKEKINRFSISLKDLRIYESQIAGKMGFSSRQDGLRAAVVRGVKLGLLDTSSLPLKPTEPFTTRESHVLVAMVKNYPTSLTCAELGISPNSVATYRSGAYLKLGRCSQYQAIAWATREMVKHGQL